MGNFECEVYTCKKIVPDNEIVLVRHFGIMVCPDCFYKGTNYLVEKGRSSFRAEVEKDYVLIDHLAPEQQDKLGTHPNRDYIFQQIKLIENYGRSDFRAKVEKVLEEKFNHAEDFYFRLKFAPELNAIRVIRNGIYKKLNLNLTEKGKKVG